MHTEGNAGVAMKDERPSRRWPFAFLYRKAYFTLVLSSLKYQYLRDFGLHEYRILP
jgi:hypothetical protein